MYLFQCNWTRQHVYYLVTMLLYLFSTMPHGSPEGHAAEFVMRYSDCEWKFSCLAWFDHDKKDRLADSMIESSKTNSFAAKIYDAVILAYDGCVLTNFHTWFVSTLLIAEKDITVLFCSNLTNWTGNRMPCRRIKETWTSWPFGFLPKTNKQKKNRFTLRII